MTKKTQTKTLVPAQYKEWKFAIQNLLNDVAKVAEERNELLRTYELDDTDSSQQENAQPLSDVLRKKASNLDSQFRLAVVGHFCRGKSTLINAMLERLLLTSDLRPNTATSTVLRHGNPERFRVTFKAKAGRQPVEYQAKSPEDLIAALAQFTSDAAVGQDTQLGNNTAVSTDAQKYIDLMQGNEESLAQLIDVVEVWLSSDFLNSNQIEIIDTPGLGSVFKDHKKVTLNIIPKVDATLFIIQPDPGISKREAAFIELIKEQVASIFFVITKADQIEKDEIPEILNFTQNVIKDIVGLSIEKIYPVSAMNALQGYWEESGFDVFLPALQQFLVNKGGINRLLSAARVGRGYCEQMMIYVEKDIKSKNQSLKELRDEYQEIKQAAHRIHQQKTELMLTIDTRVQEIILQALHGLESIPGKIRKNTEERINTLNLQQLKDADDYLQPVMKNTIVSWLQENQASFEKQMQLLSNRIKKEIQEMLGDIQSPREQELLERNFEIQLNSPITTNNIISSSIGEDIVQMLTSVGLTGIIADFIGGVIDLGAQIFNGVKGFFGKMFGGKRQQPNQNERLYKARQKICEALLTKVEDSGKNVYEVMVEGYTSYSGSRVSGVRDAIEEIFYDWGKQLQEGINNLVNSNVNARLSQLDRQIKELEQGHGEEYLEKQLAMYQSQYNQLQDLRSQLCKLEESFMPSGLTQNYHI